MNAVRKTEYWLCADCRDVFEFGNEAPLEHLSAKERRGIETEVDDLRAAHPKGHVVNAEFPDPHGKNYAGALAYHDLAAYEVILRRADSGEEHEVGAFVGPADPEEAAALLVEQEADLRHSVEAAVSHTNLEMYGTDEYSTDRCDCCGTTLGGSRHRYVGVDYK